MCAAAAMAVLAFALLCSAGAGPVCAQEGEDGEAGHGWHRLGRAARWAPRTPTLSLPLPGGGDGSGDVRMGFTAGSPLG